MAPVDGRSSVEVQVLVVCCSKKVDLGHAPVYLFGNNI